VTSALDEEIVPRFCPASRPPPAAVDDSADARIFDRAVIFTGESARAAISCIGACIDHVDIGERDIANETASIDVAEQPQRKSGCGAGDLEIGNCVAEPSNVPLKVVATGAVI